MKTVHGSLILSSPFLDSRRLRVEEPNDFKEEKCLLLNENKHPEVADGATFVQTQKKKKPCVN